MRKCENMKQTLIASWVAVAALCASAGVEIPASVSSCTNFATCAQNVRNDFVNATKKCAAEGDMATFGKLIERLAKEKVDGHVFQMWQQTANGLVDAGLAQKKRKPEEQKTLMAGFREGGTTFGLWQGAEEIGKTPDKAFGTAAANLLKRKMPQQGLSSALQFRRDQTVLGIMNRIGTESDKVAAAAPVRALAFSIKPVTRDDTNAVFDAANTTCNFLLERGKNADYAAFAKEFRTKRTDLVKGEMAKKWMARELGGYARVPDEKAFAALKAEFAKLPVDRELLGALVEFRNTVTQHIWPGLWDRVADVSRPFLNGRGKFKGVERMLADEFSLNLAGSLNDTATMKRDYAAILATAAEVEKRWEAENAREKAAREVEQLSRKNGLKFEPFKRDPAVERPNPRIVNNARGVFIRKMNEAGDWAAAVPEMEKNLNARNPNGYWDLAVACTKVGKDHRAIELCDQILGDELKARPEMKADARSLKAWISATDEKDLVQRLNAIRGDQNDKDWFNALRRAGRFYFTLDSSEKRVGWLKAVIGLSRDLLWPEEKVGYTLTWMEDAPKTADSALRSDIFKKLSTENRMGKYNTWNLFDKNAELALLKSNEKPHTAADVAGKEACVCACYDASGLHFYAKFNDPEAGKARDGIANGFYAEYDFQPGGDAPWHWNMITRADTPNVDQGAVWDAPRKGFKVGAEYIKEDAVSTDTCHVFHIYVPWILCWNEFPKTGDTWRMVFVAGWAGQFGALGGSAVHELGRGLQMTFDIPQDARAKMLKTLLRQAVKDFKAVRDKWENASFWEDADLGDPDFAKEVSEPFIKSCDELAKECMDDALTPARAEEIYATRMMDLADFRLALDKKRADYLKAKFFAK